jgi:hypothetical protein
MDKKSAILQFIAQNPGVQSADINIGIGRASIGSHARALMDAGMLIKDASNGWHIASGYVVKVEPQKLTAIDIAGEHIRKMIEAK